MGFSEELIDQADAQRFRACDPGFWWGDGQVNPEAEARGSVIRGSVHHQHEADGEENTSSDNRCPGGSGQAEGRSIHGWREYLLVMLQGLVPDFELWKLAGKATVGVALGRVSTKLEDLGVASGGQLYIK